jgi:heterodisulfide reductase subunit C
MTALAPVIPDRADGLASALVETKVLACLQCRKCSSGCPVAGRADVKPHELVRLVQLGQRDQALASRLIWQCTSCQTCSTRCPQSVDLAALNDALRRLSRAEGKAGAGAAVVTFNDALLSSVRRRGRVYELGLMTAFKLRMRPSGTTWVSSR